MSVESQLEAAVCFVAANIKDAARRAEFLDQACAGDEALRAVVEGSAIGGGSISMAAI